MQRIRNDPQYFTTSKTKFTLAISYCLQHGLPVSEVEPKDLPRCSLLTLGSINLIFLWYIMFSEAKQMQGMSI